MLSRGIVLLCMLALALVASPTARAADDDARYALVHGCYALKSLQADRFVVRTDAGYAATATDKGAAEVFRMQATELGRYLLYGKAQEFLAATDGVAADAAPSPAADWRVDVAGDAFTLTLPDVEGQALVAGEGGALGLGDKASPTARFAFDKAEGCPQYPEIETNASGEPAKGASPFSQARGMLDAHLHMMAYEFLGGSVHCGSPWHRYGVQYALPDCSQDPFVGVEVAVADGVLSGEPGRDPVGWPTFRDWPNYQSFVYEQTYWKWMERAWRGGLRMFVNLFVENEALCNLMPVKRNPECNDMVSVRREHKDIYDLQNYIDAQAGGPGKGFFRIVTDPFQARRVINDGKLAVVLGIEVSRLFECGVYNDVADCSREKIDRNLDAVYKMGVRGMELVNKFDNAFSGVAGDAGVIGPLVNSANRLETGHYWQMETCTNDGHAHDRRQDTPAGDDRDSLISRFAQLLPPGQLPLYPAAPHCNRKGLSDLGDYLVRRMMDKGMIIDPDHMSAYGRAQLLSVLESKRYSGVISSHSWADPPSLPRILALGGVVTPYAGTSTSFVKAWKETKPAAVDRFKFGFGYGADMNGFGTQGAPRGADVPNPVTYPFKALDGKVTIDKQRSGERVFDINTEGVAHYGLYPDWLEDLRKLAGDEIVEDMALGAEAYLQTWERAEGVPAEACRGSRAKASPKGLGGVPLRAGADEVLRRVGQPAVRGGRVWRWCIAGANNRKNKMTAVFGKDGRTTLVVTRARSHRAAGVVPGARSARLRGFATSFGKGIRVRRTKGGARYVYVVKGAKVAWVGVVAGAAAKTPAALRSALRSAGVK